MKKILFVFFLLICLISCQKQSAVPFLINGESGKIFPLENAGKEGKIPAGEEIHFLFEEPITATGRSLHVDFSFMEESSPVVLGFLHDSNEKNPFFAIVHPKNREATVRISIAFPDVAAFGFYVHSSSPLQLIRASVDEAFLGTEISSTEVHFGFPAHGGNFSAETVQGDFSPMVGIPGRIKILLEENPPEFVKIQGAKSIFTVQTEGFSGEIPLDTRQMGNFTAQNGIFTAQSRGIRGIVFEKAEIESTLVPIPADPGLIVSWQQDQWRQTTFELFSWPQLPQILIFDFMNHSVQDEFLKRLAFFAEKAGYRGTIPTFEEISNLHGFNAHDYRSETLAEFFTIIETRKMEISNGEKVLLEILKRNGIIVENPNGGFLPGNGSVVSISRQTSNRLRMKLLVHELLHGIYFTDVEFQEAVEREFYNVGQTERQFLLDYFSRNPNLQYDATDEYLIKNEFMAYVLQQPTDDLSEYFSKNLAQIYFMNTSEAAKVIIANKAEKFVTASKNLSAFLKGKYGFEAGRMHLINVRNL